MSHGKESPSKAESKNHDDGFPESLSEPGLDDDDDDDFLGLEERGGVWSVSKEGWNSKQGDEEKGPGP